MSAERNAPCPCGSGKKYKKCCALAVRPKQIDPVAVNRTVAYRGDTGRARQAFCQRYTTWKQEHIGALEKRFREDFPSQGVALSCKKGCVHCCSLFVVASLQECECIVHYLYRNENVLSHFLAAFEGWRNGVLKIERCFHVLNSTYHKIAAGVAGEEEKELFDQGCTNYANARLSCPFLLEGACSIYPVRPYVCAGASAVTPGEWCEVTHPRHNEAKYVKVPAITEPDMPYFLKHKGQEIISSMPFLVYRILTEGYDVLAEIPGLEGLRQMRRDENLDSQSSLTY